MEKGIGFALQGQPTPARPANLRMGETVKGDGEGIMMGRMEPADDDHV